MRTKKRGRPTKEKQPIKVIEKPVSRINKWLLFDNTHSKKFRELNYNKLKYRDWLCKLWGINGKEFNSLMHKPYNLSVLQIEHIAKETGRHPTNLFYAAGRDSTISCAQKEMLDWNSEYSLTNFYTDVSKELTLEISKYRAKEKYGGK